MPLAPGSTLGPYEVLAPLGAGGMGEVYRARDTRLGREVAVKVLPQHLNTDPEVRTRFEREARTVSSLNHPHICTLHDVGRQADTHYLVMELIEGETLAQRLERGALPMAECLRLGAQIADALDRAHRAGVVHRDLKPGNVMLTRSGAKLMDFGLARATGLAPRGGSGAGAAMTQSPTVSAPLTAEGTIVGTFQYMAPEQLEGREADARSDLWALGCVLYEMATGRRAFAGESQASLIGAIMRDRPRPLAEVAPTAPPPLDRLVQALLEKDPDERIQTAHDAKLQLQWAVEPASASGVAAAGPAGRARGGRNTAIAWTVAAVAVASALGLAALLLLNRDRGAVPVRAAIAPPPGAAFAPAGGTPLPLAISPDGSRIAYCAHLGGGPDRLWVRPLASDDARALPGTDGAVMPFFSPDGRSIAFFSGGKLRRVPADGGPVTEIADAPDPRGGSWGSRGTIVFAPRGQAGLFLVGADGGVPRAVTVLDSTVGEATHRTPHFLPDGVHFLFLARRAGAGQGREPTIYAGSTESNERTAVLGVASNVVYASGHLLYVEAGNLVARRFDPRRRAVGGPAIPISGDVRMNERFSRGTFAASQNGVLVFMTGKGATQSRLHWVDRRGTRIRDVGEPAPYTFGGSPVIDPSGRHAVICILNPERGISDVWIVDVETGRRRRLGIDGNDHYSATWTPDGARIVMNSLSPQPGAALAVGPADGSGPARTIFTWPRWIYSDCVTPDGRWVLATANDSTGLYDVIAVAMDGGGSILPLATGPANQGSARISPDGRYVAYTSSESGRDEVYVMTFPPPGGRWQASSQGGRSAIWRRDGRALFFKDAENHLTEVPVIRSGAGLEFGAPERLFQVYGEDLLLVRYDAAPDGQRFLLAIDVEEGAEPPLTLITNWVATLKR